MIGRTISHYRILSTLGAGGMGVVYKAEDLRLRRPVAIKILNPGAMDDPETRQRFLLEARAASALDHENICAIHQIDETDDQQMFLVMGYYDGETLRQKIDNSAYDPGTTLTIAGQICSGLGYAHQCGIVHRDIKPTNIMITRREQVKILDFGLVKMEGNDELTLPNSVLGTIKYMSPEQASGQEADLRTDIWSAGLLFYEMLTATHPFEGAHGPAILNAILTREPRALTEVCPNVPQAMAGAIHAALAKDRSDRPPTMAAFLKALGLNVPRSLSSRAGVGPAGAPADSASHLDPSILVLPFANLSSEPDSDYFSDGLTEEIITDLSSVRSLRVISRTSAMGLKGTTRNLTDLAAMVRVRYVMEGTVRRQGNKLRLTAKLVEAASDTILWAEKYSGTLDDIFSIQDSLSQAIVHKLEVEMSSSTRRSLMARPINDIRAYEPYLRAKQEILKFSPEGLERALSYMNVARERAGDSALILSAIGYIHWQRLNIGASVDPDDFKKVREYAGKALEMEPESSHGHRLMGLLCVLEGDLQEGVNLLNRALSIDPDDTDTLTWICSCYGISGNSESAHPLMDRLLAIDPLTPLFRAMRGNLCILAGEFEQALEPIRQSLDMDPANITIRFLEAQALALAGQRTAASSKFSVLENAASLSHMTALAGLCSAALSGDPQLTCSRLTAELTLSARGPQWSEVDP